MTTVKRKRIHGFHRITHSGSYMQDMFLRCAELIMYFIITTNELDSFEFSSLFLISVSQ